MPRDIAHPQKINPPYNSLFSMKGDGIYIDFEASKNLFRFSTKKSLDFCKYAFPWS